MEGSRLCVLLPIFLLNDDLPMDNSRLKRNVIGMFPKQIALAISSPTSMWVSWVTGDAQIGSNVIALDPSWFAGFD
ncbi:hypothetical protein SLEP1_g33156 [Rubroshorea leprosula]|uniref:Uncharacterized protein n=1 Tax=Rubroshorea leprosula TaxID=152421 RepID=A0AAV5KFS2_9ROSI|nr:hypothetical protein SLEP1_g33156 [Rubroshorea leprosula]